MKDYNSKEEVEKRASQEDPLIMYLIVRNSLGMSSGKIGAQCAHAAQMLLLKYMKDVLSDYNPDVGFYLYELDSNTFDDFQMWLDGSFRKVVLKADEKQWEKLKEEFTERERVLVIDAGLTELEPQTETVIGLFPMKKSKCPKLVSKLRLL